jgi:hypothetical protein
MTPSQFPILNSAATSAVAFAKAIDAVANGIDSGVIRNVVLSDAKFTLGRLVDHAWDKHVSQPFFHAGKWKNQPQGAQDLYDGILIMSVHDVLGASRKIEKSQAQGEAIDAMRAYFAEVLPLAKAMASLKDKVVKGRAPNKEPSKPVNPHKVVKTCPCCFRAIAVQGHVMAHHGYQRPGGGLQTSSCYGIRFRPLEVSNEGLVWLIGVYKGKLTDAEKIYSDRGKVKSLTLPLKRGQTTLVTLQKNDTGWADAFGVFVAQLESEIDSYQRTLGRLGERLDKWKPELVGAIPASLEV